MANESCPQCGAARDGDARFCASCSFDFQKPVPTGRGYSIVPTRKEPQSTWSWTAPPVTAVAEPRGGLEILLILGIIAGVVVAGLLLFSGG
jgi:hypothetical protein